MGEIVNLRTARKAATRRRNEIRAAESRIAFGRPKSERVLEEALLDKQRRQLDAHQMDREDDR